MGHAPDRDGERQDRGRAGRERGDRAAASSPLRATGPLPALATNSSLSAAKSSATGTAKAKRFAYQKLPKSRNRLRRAKVASGVSPAFSTASKRGRLQLRRCCRRHLELREPGPTGTPASSVLDPGVRVLEALGRWLPILAQLREFVLSPLTDRRALRPAARSRSGEPGGLGGGQCHAGAGSCNASKNTLLSGGSLEMRQKSTLPPKPALRARSPSCARRERPRGRRRPAPQPGRGGGDITFSGLEVHLLQTRRCCSGVGRQTGVTMPYTHGAALVGT